MTARKARPKNVEGAPTMVQPSDGPSLDEVLADIDVLEATETPLDRDDARLIEEMDGDGSDFEDENVDDAEPTQFADLDLTEPEPVTKPKRTRKPAVKKPKVAVGAAKRAGIPTLDEDVQGRQEGGWGSGPEPTRRERRTSTPRHARMSHKDCGHPIQGEAGKIARAECRARHRAEGEAVAS